MKSIKLGFIIFLCMVVSLLSGCTKQVHSLGKRDINEAFPLYSAMLFEQKNTALQKLKLSLDDLQEYGVNAYTLPDQEVIADYSYDVDLCFIKDTDEFYGFHYRANIPDIALAFQQFDAAISCFKETYGKPSTYPGLDNRYLDAENVKEKMSVTNSLVETWELPILTEWKIPSNLHYELRAGIYHEKQDNSYTILLAFDATAKRN